ncbi:TAT-variant-translocated molybdopterin oxidoreductase [Bdellovibrio reynosensis]|uniref:TAT-variant-translocated molybdopterin oxidoreductase n=1 Tax=Bdellovibrio reynosensis TaxID=2835041 RepID=A0ABY4CBG2_9BACT|nr:TAT-variant-translocated molybdopterin oxidoreductase [Bdellovibrio reynosensis]UOF02318.1 TAT-variant-translocated molybdopterin oxidoreductase [Bdellovibrio reynosensis]
MSEIHTDHELEMKKALRPKVERDNTYWLSLEQWKNDPEFMAMAETEFKSSPLKEKDGEDGWARREFLKLMGASIAMASAGCIRRPVQKIVPYNKQPEEVTLGIANYYSSAYFDGSDPIATLVKTREGRPIKIEANNNTPFSRGLDIRSQAALLALYDPERLQGPKRNLFNEKKSNSQVVDVKWEELDKKIVAELQKGDVVILTGPVASPATRAVIGDFAQGFNAKHVVWDAFANEEVQQGQKASYGEAVVPNYRFDKAKMIVSVDADFLGTWIAPTTYTAQFTEGRRDIKNMSRLVSFDSHYSLTGANADIRMKIKPSQQLDVVMGLIHEIVVNKGNSVYAGNAGVKSALSSYANVAKSLNIEPELFAKVAADLWAARGESLVVAGGLQTLTERSAELQAAVNFLNSVLENDGKTVESRGHSALKASYTDMLSLIKDMKDGKVKTLIIHRVNPAFVLPAEAGFADAIKKVNMVVYTGDRIDETGIYADYVTPDNHALESWNDIELANGVYAICQPAIRPMYDTRSFQLSLMTWAYTANRGPARLRDYETFYDYLRVFWKSDILPKVGKGKDFEDFWQSTLQAGYVGEMANGSSARSFKTDAFTSIKPASAKTGFEVVLYPTSQMGDGSMANVSWLHETPDPVTKIVWDNYVSVSLGTAEKHGLKEATVVEITIGDKKMELPVHIQPGMHDDVLAIAVGYGRTRAGKVGNGVGKNAFALATIKDGQMIFSGQTATFTKTSKKYQLANVQGHHTMEGRNIVATATLKDYNKKKDAGIHRHHTWSIWSGHEYSGHKWGMAIDTNTCTGCSACMVACQSENNVPVVGKEYVLMGREMHWLRIDRYYYGDPSNPEAVFQPMLCQHCDNAPCETVCPVLATVHSDEGLNDMVYNRCVGTRYCANNCPYKVRRFNWFNFAKQIEKPLHMALNPSVGVRTRGVMEKCTFCVQRIQEAKTVARNEKRALKDGDVKTACQTACPPGGIVFGDLNDPNSEVHKIFKNDERGFFVLEEWNAKPNIRYLSKIRNNDKESTGGHNGHGTAKQGEHS